MRERLPDEIAYQSGREEIAAGVVRGNACRSTRATTLAIPNVGHFANDLTAISTFEHFISP